VPAVALVEVALPLLRELLAHAESVVVVRRLVRGRLHLELLQVLLQVLRAHFLPHESLGLVNSLGQVRLKYLIVGVVLHLGVRLQGVHRVALLDPEVRVLLGLAQGQLQFVSSLVHLRERTQVLVELILRVLDGLLVENRHVQGLGVPLTNTGRARPPVLGLSADFMRPALVVESRPARGLLLLVHVHDVLYFVAGMGVPIYILVDGALSHLEVGRSGSCRMTGLPLFLVIVHNGSPEVGPVAALPVARLLGSCC